LYFHATELRTARGEQWKNNYTHGKLEEEWGIYFVKAKGLN
jgi:hypothetical protein